MPYPEPPWPCVSLDQEQAILHLLLPALRPIGDFRRHNVPRSKGKNRSRKPKQPQGTAEDKSRLPEWMPDIYDGLTIGFNSTVRRLDTLASRRRQSSPSSDAAGDHPPDAAKPLRLIFVCREALPTIMTSNLALLVASSSPTSTRARLVPVSLSAEAQLAEALAQPRIGVLGLEGAAPETQSLVRLVDDTVEPVDIPWLNHGGNPEYYPTRIETVDSGPRQKVPRRAAKRKRADQG